MDKPIEVTLDLVIESIDTFDDLNKLLDISVVMTVNWKDPMLALNQTKNILKKNCFTLMKVSEESCNISAYFTTPLIKAADMIWLPELRIPNLVNSQNIGFYADSVPTQLSFKSCDGTLTFERAQTLTLSCNTDFSLYPFDVQVCMLKIFNLADTGPGKRLVFNKMKSIKSAIANIKGVVS